MMMTKRRVGLLLGLLIVAGSVHATLIASEGFRTSGAADDYINGSSLSSTACKGTVLGNSGFVASRDWAGLVSGVRAMNWLSLTHSGMTGTAEAGNVSIWNGASTVDENSYRQVGVTPVAESSVYYMSGLLRPYQIAGLEDGEFRSVGFMNSGGSTADISKGFHFGVSKSGGKVHLAIFAGGNTYNVKTIYASNASTVFQVVLKLEVNAAGSDIITAWWAKNGDLDLTQILTPRSVETWSSVGDLDVLRLQRKADSGAGSSSQISFDEIRFGTERRDVSKLSTERKLYKISVDPQFTTGVPIYSDVLFTTRWITSAGNLTAMADFGATKSVWTILNGTASENAAFVSNAKAIVSEVQGAVQPQFKFADHPGAACLDLNGNEAILPWLRQSPQTHASGDVNTAEYTALWLERAKALIDAGCDSLQQDDVRLTASMSQYGASFTAQNMTAFNTHLSFLTTAQLADLGITNFDVNTYDYAAHLRGLTPAVPVGDDFGAWAPGGSEEKLKDEFYTFQQESVVGFYEDVFAQLKTYAGHHVIRSGNNGDTTKTWYYDQFDYMQGEIHPSEQDPLSMYSQVRQTLEHGLMQTLLFIPNFDLSLDRRTMAAIYAAGSLPLAPWDVWMGKDKARFFGDPNDYKDLYQFVKDKKVYFDDYENVAVNGWMGPWIESVTYDASKSRTFIKHVWRTNFVNVANGSEVVINGNTYTTSGSSTVGYIYLAGDMTSTIKKGDILSSLSEESNRIDSSVTLVSFNRSRGRTTITHSKGSSHKAVGLGEEVVINGQHYLTSGSSGVGSIYLKGDLTGRIRVGDTLVSMSTEGDSHVDFTQVYMSRMNGHRGSAVTDSTYDSVKGRTTVTHTRRNDALAVSSGAEVVINGVVYTTSGATGVGNIYLSGDLTGTIGVGDGVTRIAATRFVEHTADDRYNVGKDPVTVRDMGIMAFTRCKSWKSTTPVVIHLIDYMNNGAFEITLRPERFFNSDQIKVTVLRPGAASVSTTYTNLDTIQVAVPDLNIGNDSWGLLVVERQ